MYNNCRLFLRKLINKFWQFEPTFPHAGLGPIGYLRHVQNTRETGSRKNPDDHVKYFLKRMERLHARREDLQTFRMRPFYHYLLARTLFYEKVFVDAIANNFKQLIIIGVGTDTRSFRYRKAIDAHGVRVIENDLQPWMRRRAILSKKLARPSDFRQVEMDLERINFDDWIRVSQFDGNLKTQFIMEGVTPYITPGALAALLSFVGMHTLSGSRIAYDFKLVGYDFKLAKEQEPLNPTDETFRMPVEHAQISEFHRNFNLDVKTILLAGDVQHEFLAYDYETSEYVEDGVIVASVS